MPPKKKKGSGKKKKGKKSGKKSAKASSQSEHLNELSKEFYLIQIKDLEARLARYNEYNGIFLDRPPGHTNVVSQDRWSLVTGSVILIEI